MRKKLKPIQPYTHRLLDIPVGRQFVIATPEGDHIFEKKEIKKSMDNGYSIYYYTMEEKEL